MSALDTLPTSVQTATSKLPLPLYQNPCYPVGLLLATDAVAPVGLASGAVASAGMRQLLFRQEELLQGQAELAKG